MYRDSQDLYQQAWTLAWSLPTINTQCEAQEFCVQISNTETTDALIQNSLQFKKLIDKINKRLLAQRVSKAAVSKFRRKSLRLHEENLNLAAGVPAFSSDCTPPLAMNAAPPLRLPFLGVA